MTRSRALEEIAERAKAQAHEPVALTKVLPPGVVRMNQERALGVEGDNAIFHLLGAVFIGGFALLGVVLARSEDTAPERALLAALVVGGVLMIGWYVVARRAAARRRAAAIAEALAWARSLPFEVVGFEDYLASTAPVIVATLRAPVDEATFGVALSSVGSKIETRALEPNVFQIRVPPVVETGEPPKTYADGRAGRGVVEQVLVPLHHDLGVVRVVMGHLPV